MKLFIEIFVVIVLILGMVYLGVRWTNKRYASEKNKTIVSGSEVIKPDIPASYKSIISRDGIGIRRYPNGNAGFYMVYIPSDYADADEDRVAIALDKGIHQEKPLDNLSKYQIENILRFIEEWEKENSLTIHTQPKNLLDMLSRIKYECNMKMKSYPDILLMKGGR